MFFSKIPANTAIMAIISRVSLLLTLSLVAFCVGKGSLNDDQEVAVRNAFQQILKLRPPNENGNHRVAKPPKHMLELYQKYSNNGGMRKTSGNTIRSILPTIKDSEMLLFNVTCIDRAEEVNLAQLHLHRRRLRRSSSPSHRRRILAPPCKVKLYQILPSKGKQRARSVPLASLPVTESIRGGWHSLDITAVLRELLLSGPSSSMQLGVRFEAPRNRPITPEHFLKMSNETSAFLVAFSEESPDNSVLTGNRNPVRHTHAIATMIKHNAGSDVGTDEDLQSSDELTKYSGMQRPPQKDINVSHDDLYLENDNVIEEPTIDKENKDDSDIDDFTFESEEGLKTQIKGGLKKMSPKGKGKKSVAKGILDSLDDERKDSVRVIKKRKPKMDGNNFMDEEIKENIVSRKGMKKGPVTEKDSWLIRGDSEASSKGVFRRRRMHPKTRFRVREWRDEKVTENDNDKRERLIKFTDESSLQSSSQSQVDIKEDESMDYKGEKTLKRNARSTRDDEDPSNADPAEFFHTVQNAIDVEGILNKDGDVEFKVKRTEIEDNNPNSLGRNSRSIHDNELPDSQLSGSKEIPRTSPETLLENRVTQEATRNSAHVIPYPGPPNRRWRGEGRRRRGRGKKRDSKKKGKTAKKRIETWQSSGEQTKSTEDRVPGPRMGSVDSPSCHRKKLQVDFADIGWSDWIISPPQFEAYYCSGRCAYPLAKVVKPTNHATLQSLISAIGHQPEVPEPCCVPDKLSSTSLLYFDDNQNVVLKNYPDMSVESCACR